MQEDAKGPRGVGVLWGGYVFRIQRGLAGLASFGSISPSYAGWVGALMFRWLSLGCLPLCPSLSSWSSKNMPSSHHTASPTGVYWYCYKRSRTSRLIALKNGTLQYNPRDVVPKRGRPQLAAHTHTACGAIHLSPDSYPQDIHTWANVPPPPPPLPFRPSLPRQ